MTQAPPAARDRALPLSTAFAFAATSLPLQAVIIAVAVYLPRHYASHLGVDLAVVGAAFFIVRMIDIPVDGLLGWVMDKTRTRWGRYRVWTVVGAPFLMASMYWLFMPAEGVGRTIPGVATRTGRNCIAEDFSMAFLVASSTTPGTLTTMLVSPSVATSAPLKPLASTRCEMMSRA